MTKKHSDLSNSTQKSSDQMLIGENVGFSRTRRITGYLVGTVDRFNNAKRAEEKDRVKHDCSQSAS